MRYLFLLLILNSPFAWAEGERTYDRVSLTASASEKVAEDVMIADLYVQFEGKDVADLAERLNQHMSQTLAIAKAASFATVRSGQYSTSPIYNKARIERWRVRQSLHVESKDFVRLQSLLSKLQTLANISSIQFKVSDEKSEATRSRLIDLAIANFKQRAKQVSSAFGHQSYRIVDVVVDTGSNIPHGPVMYAKSMMMADRAVSTAPAIASGKQKIEVLLSGSIELQIQ